MCPNFFFLILIDVAHLFVPIILVIETIHLIFAKNHWNHPSYYRNYLNFYPSNNSLYLLYRDYLIHCRLKLDCSHKIGVH